MQKKERFLVYAGNWREDGGSTPSHGELDLNHVIRKELVYQGLAAWKIVNGKTCCDAITIIGGGGGTSTFTITPGATSAVFNVNGTSQTLGLVDLTNAGLLSPTLLTTINNLVTLSGTTAGNTELGTFTGVTIPDNTTVKTALQSLETSLETKQKELTFKSSGTQVGITGAYDKINVIGATVAQNSAIPSQIDITVEGGIKTYDAGNGAIVKASGLGVTFVRNTASVWTFTIPVGVDLLSHNIYSTAGQNPGVNVTINYNYAGNTLTNQGLNTANPPSYSAFQVSGLSTSQGTTGGTLAANFRPNINSVGSGNISMLCILGSVVGTQETLIKGIF
jgi:hypothetical protein